MKRTNAFLKVAALSLVMLAAGCKKEEPPANNPGTGNPNPNPNPTPSYVLIIDQGAQAIDQGESLALTAHLVNGQGNVVTPGGVTWSSNVGSVNGNVFTASQATVGTISASVQYEGVTYTSAIPINIVQLKSTRAFGVVPSAIIWQTNAGDIQLSTVYVGNQSASYAFSSDNNNVATVSSSGLVHFVAAGNANIKVTGTIGGQASEFIVPVMVVGAPAVPLPVTRISVTPVVAEMFKGETQQFTARAYNSNGDDVTANVTFQYTVIEKKEDDDIAMNPVEISSTGVVTAKNIGAAYVKVTAKGVTGQAELVVNPDTMIMVNPFNVTFGTDYTKFPPVPGPTSVTLNAKTYKIDRTKYKAKDPGAFVEIPNAADLKWELPLTGIPQIDDQFKVVTLKNATKDNVLVEAIPGKVGSTFVIAHAGTYGGGASIMVNP